MSNFLPLMSWVDVADAAARKAVAIVPIGTVEANGPQLPMGYDYLVSQALAEQAAAKTGDVWLPPITYGVSEAIDAFPGTVSVSSELLTRQIEAVLDSLGRAGFERIVLITHHGPNQAPAENACRDFRRRTGLLVASINPAQIARDLAEGMFEPREFGHGAEPGASLMLHLHPGSVQPERTASRDVGTLGGLAIASPNDVLFGKSRVNFFLQLEEVSPTSAWGDASAASAEKGKALFEKMVAFVADFLVHMQGFDTRQAPPAVAAGKG